MISFRVLNTVRSQFGDIGFNIVNGKTDMPRTEIQLLHYQEPNPVPDSNIRDLHKIGMNHICFAVDDIEAEVAKLRANGFKTRNEIMDCHSRKLVFIDGPEGVTIELAEWH